MRQRIADGICSKVRADRLRGGRAADCHSRRFFSAIG